MFIQREDFGAANNPSGPQSGSSPNRGFASMDEDKQRDAARKGGRNVPDQERSFSKDHELASDAGRRGGESRGSSASAGTDKQRGEGRDREGNFAQDRERASEAGRKGGQQ